MYCMLCAWAVMTHIVRMIPCPRRTKSKREERTKSHSLVPASILATFPNGKKASKYVWIELCTVTKIHFPSYVKYQLIWLTLSILSLYMRNYSGFSKSRDEPLKFCCALWKCMKLLFEWHYLIWDFHNAISKGSCLWSGIPFHILSHFIEPRLLVILF